MANPTFRTMELERVNFAGNFRDLYRTFMALFSQVSAVNTLTASTALGPYNSSSSTSGVGKFVVTGGAYTTTLPLSTAAGEQEITITAGDTNAQTIAVVSGDYLNGTQNGTIVLQAYQSNTLYSDGNGNWWTKGTRQATSANTQTGTTYTVADTDTTIIVNGSATCTVTLLAAASCAGRRLRLVTTAAYTVVSASSNVIPLAGGAAGTAILAATAGKWADVESNGTSWIITASN